MPQAQDAVRATAQAELSGTAVRTVLAAGALAGILDILAACVNAGIRGGTPPAAVLRSVASGVLGTAARDGGAEAAALGLLLHFVIATGWALVFYAASRKSTILLERPVLAGALYGVIVCTLMYQVVIPLSAVPQSSAKPSLASYAIRYGIHIFFVGLPIALVTARRARREGQVGRSAWTPHQVE